MTGHQVLLFIHLFAVAIAMGIGFSNNWALIVGKGQPVEIQKGMAFLRHSLRYVGDGLVLTILVTGIWQLVRLGGMGNVNGWFQAKMVFVTIFVLAYGAMRYTASQMMKTKNMALVPRVVLFARIAWPSMVGAMFCAVMTFAG